MLTSARLGGLVVLAVLAGGCSERGDDRARLGDAHVEHDWSYTDVDAWAETCATGEQQSPVDLAGAESEDLADVEFDYSAADASVLDNGHTVQTTFEDAGSIELDGETYELRQFHFHSPSEHQVDGVPYAAEMHLVHESDDGRLAVVGVLVQDGMDNPVVDTVLDAVPEEGADARDLGVLDPAALLPDERATFRYDGSLTTPPCSEGVAWSVLVEPVTWSTAQLAAFAERHPDSHRPVQPVGDRVLVLDTD